MGPTLKHNSVGLLGGYTTKSSITTLSSSLHCFHIVLILCCIIVLDVISIYLYLFFILLFGIRVYLCLFLVFVYGICLYCRTISGDGVGYHLDHFLIAGDIPIECILYALFSTLLSWPMIHTEHK